MVRTLAFLLVLAGCARLAGAQSVELEPTAPHDRVDRLERRVADLEQAQRATPPASAGFVVFLSGAFCALWAQNSGRNPWLWFFLGAVFNVLALLVLLSKNAADARERPPV